MSTTDAIDTFTLTFGDCMENHTGMEIIGKMADRGFSLSELTKIGNHFKKLGAVVKIMNLNKLLSEEYRELVDDNAYLLVIEKGIDFINKNYSDLLYNEHSSLDFDKKYLDPRRKRVLSKHARWNLCFDDEGRDSDYENGKGTIIAYNDVPITKEIKNYINDLCNRVSDDSDHIDLKLEANYYYDVTKTGIGYHGDTERRRVIGVRIGKPIPITFRWYCKYEVISDTYLKMLNHGDIYIMSDKTVGTDWKKSSKITLRHAAGCKKYID